MASEELSPEELVSLVKKSFEVPNGEFINMLPIYDLISRVTEWDGPAGQEPTWLRDADDFLTLYGLYGLYEGFSTNQNTIRNEPQKDPTESIWADRVAFTSHEIEVVRKYIVFKYTTAGDAFAEYKSAEMAFNKYPEEVVKAKNLLALNEAQPINLLQTTKSSIEANPLKENEYWEAYWILKNKPPEERLRDATIQKLLADEIVKAKFILDWPGNWNDKYAPIWLELGGDAFTVKKWNIEGWDIELLMLNEEIPSRWNGTLTERVLKEDPPTPGYLDIIY